MHFVYCLSNGQYGQSSKFSRDSMSIFAEWGDWLVIVLLAHDCLAIQLYFRKITLVFLRLHDNIMVMVMILKFKIFYLSTFFACDADYFLSFLVFSDVDDAVNAEWMHASEKHRQLRFRKWGFASAEAAFGHGCLLYLHLNQLIKWNL